VIVAEQRLHRLHRVAGLADDVEDQRVVDAHAADQRLGRRVTQPVKSLLRPADLALERLAGRQLLALLGRLGRRPPTLDHALGRPHDHAAGSIKASAARAAGDLMKLARPSAASGGYRQTSPSR
jgi:hypothetical protein